MRAARTRTASSCRQGARRAPSSPPRLVLGAASHGREAIEPALGDLHERQVGHDHHGENAKKSGGSGVKPSHSLNGVNGMMARIATQAPTPHTCTKIADTALVHSRM